MLAFSGLVRAQRGAHVSSGVAVFAIMSEHWFRPQDFASGAEHSAARVSRPSQRCLSNLLGYRILRPVLAHSRLGHAWRRALVLAINALSSVFHCAWAPQSPSSGLPITAVCGQKFTCSASALCSKCFWQTTPQCARDSLDLRCESGAVPPVGGSPVLIGGCSPLPRASQQRITLGGFGGPQDCIV